MFLTIRGNSLTNFFGTNEAKIELVEQKWTKYATFVQVNFRGLKVDFSIFAFFGFKKGDFSTLNFLASKHKF